MFFLPYLYKFLVYRKNFDIVICQRDKVDESQGYLVSGFCVWCGHVWCGISGHALNAKASKVVVLKCVFAFKVPLIAKAQNFLVLKTGYGSLKFNI